MIASFADQNALDPEIQGDLLFSGYFAGLSKSGKYYKVSENGYPSFLNTLLPL